MIYVFSFCGTSQNLSQKFIVTKDVLSYGKPFVKRIVCPIASVIVSGEEIAWFFVQSTTKMKITYFWGKKKDRK